MSFILIHEDKGIFNNIAEITATGQKFDVFSKDEKNKYNAFYAKTFLTEVEAVTYINEVFSPEFTKKLKIVPLDGDYHQFINYYDLLKNGMAEYTGYMINSIPMISTETH